MSLIWLGCYRSWLQQRVVLLSNKMRKHHSVVVAYLIAVLTPKPEPLLQYLVHFSINVKVDNFWHIFSIAFLLNIKCHFPVRRQTPAINRSYCFHAPKCCNSVVVFPPLEMFTQSLLASSINLTNSTAQLLDKPRDFSRCRICCNFPLGSNYLIA